MLGEGPPQPGIKTLSSQDAQQAAPSLPEAQVVAALWQGGGLASRLQHWAVGEPCGCLATSSWHPSPARPLWLGLRVQRTLPATFTGAPHILAGTPHRVLTLPVWQTLTLSAQ